MEADFNKRVRKVLVNSFLIISVSIITYLLYSTIEKNKEISAKDKRILIDSITILAKVKELKSLRNAYEMLESERDSLGLTNDSLITMVATLNEFIREAEQKDSVNATKMAQFNVAIRKASVKLAIEKEELRVIEEHHTKPDPTAVASAEKKGFVFQKTPPLSIVEVQIDKMELEAINRAGKVLSKDQYTAKQIKHVRVKFIMVKSSLNRTIQKIFHLQLMEPDGNAYQFNPDYDYTFIDRNKIHRSTKNKVDYNGHEKQVAFLYPKATPFKPGQNIIQLFCDNKLVGEKDIFIKQ